MFTGDAEAISEKEQLASDFELSADVLKAGHHGSNSSTTQKYLDAVSPSYAVIFCGADNSYGHPHDEIISRLTEKNIKFYRTDENGTISFSSDRQTITVKTERRSGLKVPNTTPPNNSTSYIGNKNTKVFHIPKCSYLPAEKNRVYFTTREEAESKNYRPCQKCLK